MKKTLLLLASAALLLVGCAKEQLSNGLEGELTKVTFTASLDNGVATKAVDDGDGAAASVNRCIMEIYYGDELFARQYAPVNEQKKATFTAQVVSNRTYTVAFWADKVDATTEAGLQVDKYYTTNATGGLQAITIKGSYLGNDDARDAFFYVGNDFTVAQTGTSWNDIKLKRPFAQMNVITTDWDKVTTVASLKPEKVNVTLKNALVNFNAVTGEASGSETLTYEASVYTAPAPLASALANEKTLSMDYLFASDTKALIDIDWKALHGTDADVEHAFAAVPYQRNYRTNIKGALLTTTGQWTVEVYPNWGNGTDSGEIDHPVVIATTLAEAQAAVGPASTGTEAAGTVIVKPEAVTNRDQSNDKNKSDIISQTNGIEDKLPDGAKAIEFVLTPQSKEDVTFELPALPADTETEKFYWYIRHEENYPTKNLNVKVSDNDKTRVIIDAPNQTHVVLNDVGYEHVIAITGQNTLVVPQGIKVDKLTVKKGGVEIHGTVTELEIIGTEDEVFFRSCENLSQTVFAKIKDNLPTVHNYIDTPQYAEKLNSDGTYDIVSPVCKIDNSYFFSLSEAVATVGTEETTITLLRDMKFTAPINIWTKKIILNTNGMNLDATGLRAIEIYGGKLTVNGNGKFLASNTTGDNNAILNLYSGELVVNDVYLEGANTCIAAAGGKATINNATMKALDGGCCVFATNDGVININGMIFTCGGDDPDGPGACWARDGGTVNVYGGTFNAVPLSNKTLEPEVLQANYCLYDYNDITQYGFVPGHVNVYGGTFIDFNPANNYSGHSFLAGGYQSVQDGNNWIVSAINN